MPVKKKATSSAAVSGACRNGDEKPFPAVRAFVVRRIAGGAYRVFLRHGFFPDPGGGISENI